MFEFGRGVKRDYTPAVKYYKAAAEQGHVEAESRLQSVYEKVNREYVEAQKAVAQQQQDMQERFRQQLLQVQQQQLLHLQLLQQQHQQQHHQQVMAAHDGAHPTNVDASIESMIAGTASFHHV